MNDREKIRELCRLLNTNERDIIKSLERLKKEIEAMKN
jgi:hypothetical protein